MRANYAPEGLFAFFLFWTSDSQLRTLDGRVNLSKERSTDCTEIAKFCTEWLRWQVGQAMTDSCPTCIFMLCCRQISKSVELWYWLLKYAPLHHRKDVRILSQLVFVVWNLLFSISLSECFRTFLQSDSANPVSYLAAFVKAEKSAIRLRQFFFIIIIEFAAQP